MDMDAASTSNHHQGYGNESREATKSQTARIDCEGLRILEPELQPETRREKRRRREGRGRLNLAGEDLEEHQNEKRNKIEGK